MQSQYPLRLNNLYNSPWQGYGVNWGCCLPHDTRNIIRPEWRVAVHVLVKVVHPVFNLAISIILSVHLQEMSQQFPENALHLWHTQRHITVGGFAADWVVVRWTGPMIAFVLQRLYIVTSNDHCQFVGNLTGTCTRHPFYHGPVLTTSQFLLNMVADAVNFIELPRQPHSWSSWQGVAESTMEGEHYVLLHITWCRQ